MTIDALDWLRTYDQQRPATSYMFGVANLIDSPRALDYDPLIHAETIGVPVIVNGTLPTPQMIACYSPRRRAIFVRPNVPAAVERCAIAHEIVHFEYNDHGTTRWQEDRADRRAARRLIRPSRLAEAAEFTDDHGRMALELNVTERIMRVYLRLRGA